MQNSTFEGPTAFAQLIRDAVADAAAQGVREMVWSDADFFDWPLCEKSVIDALNVWANRHRRLVILAHNFDVIPRKHPRFVEWRRMWGHIVECRVAKQWDATEFPSAMWMPSTYVQRLDPARFRGIVSNDALGVAHLKEALNEVHKQSSPGFPATVLGL
ncbi:hypothetical protein [Rhodoferax aquaticus]|uniref:Uncharacterized protein n=1 Tax=Rhodoferax aquaticus TaxID=2527691 RepID=A0A515EMM6_9BURK|nr:hypothetical protein [Rhodoferax aquaticus]QDL53911.1 hypothetical protein EXZ61_06875 [Rhodoferax aquaticus]